MALGRSGGRRAKTVSVAIAYILLMVAAFLADALLAAVFASFLYRGLSGLLRVVEQFTKEVV